jgi:hypothetical protein
MQSPVKKIYITQVFGVNVANYAKFGLKGHNGIDYRAFLPNGERCYEGGKSEVFAPHDGKIIENVYDENGYGHYVKIENDSEGSVLAHFSSASPRKVGESVKMGDFIGYQGTTGNSTGIHLHWGYYKQPRDRANGFNGFINQAGLYMPYNQGGNMGNEFENTVKKSTQWDKTVEAYMPERNPVDAQFEDLQRVVSGYKGRVTDLEKQLENEKIARKTAETEVANKTEQLANETAACQRTIDTLKSDIATLQKLNKTLSEAVGSHAPTIAVLEGKLREAETLTGKQKITITQLETRLDACLKGQPPIDGLIRKLVKWFSIWKS